MKSEIWWYAARSAGVLAWVLSAASVVWGLVLASPSLRRRATEASVADLHRFLGGLAAGFLGVHLLAVVADTGDERAVTDVLVPFGAGVDRLALALGWLAALALVLVEVTSLLRRHLADALWRRAHHAGFAVFVLATVHGLQIGTDADTPALWWPAAALAAAVVGLVVARVYLNGSPLAPTEVDPPAGEIEVEVRPGADLLERTLEGLRNLDDPPVGATAEPVPVHDEVADPFAVPAAPPARTPAITPEPVRPEFGEELPPRPLGPGQAVSGSLFPTTHELGADPDPGALDLTVPASSAGPAGGAPAREPMTPAPVATTPPSAAPVARSLPVRTPRRLARTTAAAETIDGWRPTRADDAGRLVPPAPPTEIDPSTGEPDPQAYRKWLREWLAYVESQA